MRSAYCAPYSVSRVFVSKTLSNLLPMLFVWRNSRSSVIEVVVIRLVIKGARDLKLQWDFKVHRLQIWRNSRSGVVEVVAIKLVIKCARDLKLQWDFEVHGLEVHIVAVHYKRSLWDLELSTVTEVRFTTNCYSWL